MVMIINQRLYDYHFPVEIIIFVAEMLGCNVGKENTTTLTSHPYIHFSDMCLKAHFM